MNIFDTHAHYTDKKFAPDLDKALCAQKAQGVTLILNCGSDIADSRAALKIAEKYDFCFAACGVHPHEAGHVAQGYSDELAALLAHKKCVALGEIGLDYHYDFAPRETQKNVFQEQLALAKAFNLPVSLHDREAHGDMYSILRTHKPKGVLHCFSGGTELMRETLRLGLYIGLGGVVTFKNAKNASEVARTLPLDRLLLETDAPYMAPEPHRGRRCESSMITFTAEKIARLRGMEPQELIDICNANGRELFGV